MSKQNRKFRSLEAVAAFSLQDKPIETPSWLRLKDFDLGRAQSFQITAQLSLTIVPPYEIFDGERVDFERLMAHGHPWIVVVPDAFGNLSAQELELSKQQEKLTVKLIRGANRPEAVGVATQDKEGISFTLQTVGGTSKRAQTLFRGRLDASGRLKFETTLKAHPDKSK